MKYLFAILFFISFTTASFSQENKVTNTQILPNDIIVKVLNEDNLKNQAVIITISDQEIISRVSKSVKYRRLIERILNGENPNLFEIERNYITC